MSMSIWLEMLRYTNPADIPKEKWDKLRRIMLKLLKFDVPNKESAATTGKRLIKILWGATSWHEFRTSRRAYSIAVDLVHKVEIQRRSCGKSLSQFFDFTDDNSLKGQTRVSIRKLDEKHISGGSLRNQYYDALKTLQIKAGETNNFFENYLGESLDDFFENYLGESLDDYVTGQKAVDKMKKVLRHKDF